MSLRLYRLQNRGIGFLAKGFRVLNSVLGYFRFLDLMVIGSRSCKYIVNSISAFVNRYFVAIRSRQFAGTWYLVADLIT